MDYCTAHFGKQLNEVTIQDLTTYFTEERLENDQLEFKSINPTGNLSEKISGIQKTVCAFLNSSGGLIIWGAPEGEKISGKQEKVFKGELTFFNQILEKDFIISKISDSIIPLPNNIRINILVNDTKSAVLFEIDASEYSPHQNGNIYYMRIDGQTKPAPHHYVEALFKKIKYPNLEAHLKVVKVEAVGNFYKVDIAVFFFNWSPLQNEQNLSFRINTEGIFARSKHLLTSHMFSHGGHEFFKQNVKDVFYFGEPVYEIESILYEPYKIQRADSKAQITVTFGGKFSPRKSCEYILDFGKMYSVNPNDMVSIKIENKLSKDLHDEKGSTKESIIKELLGK